jgi:hypothetical protein
MRNLLTHHIENKTIVEYALRESTKPIGVASYRIVSTLPQDLWDSYPPLIKYPNRWKTCDRHKHHRCELAYPSMAPFSSFGASSRPASSSASSIALAVCLPMVGIQCE